jgi:quercetin dioxygenase-like cupin family protein
MIEKLYNFTRTDEKTIERIIEDDHAAINHMVLPQGAALPEHHANSNVYMIVVRGEITLRLDAQEPHAYVAGSILVIPHRTKMNVSNQRQEAAEIFVVKAPGPKNMDQ